MEINDIVCPHCGCEDYDVYDTDEDVEGHEIVECVCNNPECERTFDLVYERKLIEIRKEND